MNRRNPQLFPRLSVFAGALAALGSLLPGITVAQVPDAVSLGRFHAYEQDANGGAPVSSGGFVLASVSFRQVVGGVSARVVKPDGSSVALAASGDDFVFDSPDYSTATALRTDWPDGAYRIELSGAVTGTYRIRLSGVGEPAAPNLKNLPAAQNIANGQGFTLSFDPLQGATPTDAVLTSVLNDTGNYRWMSPQAGQTGAIPAGAAAATLPSLPSDAELTGSLAFGRTAEEFTANDGATAVSAGIAAVTYFPLRTGNGGAGSGAIAGEITIADGSGWRWSNWLGNYYRASGYWPWIYHAEHGWFYTHPDGRGGLFFWQPSMGWLWTNPTAYTYVYSYNRGSWLYYKPGSKSPRWFYDAGANRGWFSVQ